MRRLVRKVAGAKPVVDLVRYALVGGTAAVVDLTVFGVFAKWLGYNYLAVSTASFLLATLVNYLLSIRFVFESGARFSRASETTLVYLVSGVGLLANQAVLYSCVEWLGIELMLSKIAATGVVFFWNFGVRRQLIFRPRRVAANDEPG